MTEIAEQIERTFKRERQQLVALDWDTDIVPLLDNDDLSLGFWQGPSMHRLVDSMRHTLEFAPNILGRSHPLLNARHIVFELSIHPDYELPMPHLGILSDFLTQLPNNPDIVWGLSRDPKQELTTLSKNLAKADNEKAITAYIINKMKQYGANQIFVREADDDWGYWHVDWLVYTKGFNTMAVRVIRLNEDDSLTLISNSYSDYICNDDEYWEYGDTDTEETFSLKMFHNTLGFVLPFFQNEEIYTNYQTSSEDDD